MLPLDHVHPIGEHSTDARTRSAIERLAILLVTGFGIVLGMAAALWVIAQIAS